MLYWQEFSNAKYHDNTKFLRLIFVLTWIIVAIDKTTSIGI